jgi:bifunctional DNA-binding transcriptional regulator/antitoxin component of YhaV-PrlF toxin-antitoxin module
MMRMGYVTKLQVIKRANDTRQFYVICPAALAQALEMEPGEELEWVVEDRNTLIVRRTPPAKRGRKRGKRG